jgi:uncharacterized protein (UPF0276 family)
MDELVSRTKAAEKGRGQEACGGPPLPIDFLEVSPENYMGRGGAQPATLAWLAERYPVVTHGLTMSLGARDDLDEDYLTDLARIVSALGSPWHSDHLCVGSVGGRKLHDLLPVAFKEASLPVIADHVAHARDALGVPMAVENISYYWHPGHAEMTEPEFLTRLCDRAACGLMLDVNNAYVNAQNFGFDADAWMRAAPLDRVVQIHVAGHEWFALDAGGLGEATAARAPGSMIVDTHGAGVDDPVLALLERVLARTGPVPVLLERDQNVPSLDGLLAEMAQIRAVVARATGEAIAGDRETGREEGEEG